MLRFLFKLIVLLVLAVLAYGLWLGYQEKTPEGKKEVRTQLGLTSKRAARALNDAAFRVLEKGWELIKKKEAEEGGREVLSRAG